MKVLLPLLAAVLATTASADQLAVLSKEDAERAVERIKESSVLVAYCSQCNDEYVRILSVDDATLRRWSGRTGDYEVQVLARTRFRSAFYFQPGAYRDGGDFGPIRGREAFHAWQSIDLAYVYVPDRNDRTRLRCLGLELGLDCDVETTEIRLPAYAARPRLELVAQSERRWTGVAVSQEGRIFVNYPRWSDDVPVSVAELAGGSVLPYPPGGSWNDYAPLLEIERSWTCVQSVVVDDRNRLWVLDPASPKFEGVVPGAAKLVQFDLETDAAVRIYAFDDAAAPVDSYLNDVRIDTERGVAYISDSGRGAIVVLDLESGEARRLLDGHPAMRSEGIVLNIGGRDWLRGDTPPDVHADGIALSPDREWIYVQALTGRNLYRVPTAALRDPALSDEELRPKIERVIASGASDGIVFGKDGALYLSSLEHDAIRCMLPSGVIETVIQDPRIAWPDSFAVDSHGTLYFTTARIHEAEPSAPFGLWRFQP